MKTILLISSLLLFSACATTGTQTTASAPQAWRDDNIDWARVERTNQLAQSMGVLIVWKDYPQKKTK